MYGSAYRSVVVHGLYLGGVRRMGSGTCCSGGIDWFKIVPLVVVLSDSEGNLNDTDIVFTVPEVFCGS